jgi:hypothetical protein
MISEKQLQPKEYRIYKPNSKNSGAATKFQCRVKEVGKGDKKYPELFLFVEMAQQTGTDENDNAKFDWAGKENPNPKSVTMKLGLPDVGEILLVLMGRKKFVGPEPKEGQKIESGLFHQNNDGNTSMRLKWDNGKLYLNLSAQDKAKNLVKVSHSITMAEAVVLEHLLQHFIVAYHAWG